MFYVEVWVWQVLSIVCVLVGTWFVAYEVVNRFQGYAYKVIDVRFDGSATSEKTDEFKRWEMKRAIWMWLGLVFITIGSLIQIALIYCLR